MTEHIFLAGTRVCKVCGGSGDQLTDQCCGYELDDATLYAISNGGLEFTCGEWHVAPKPIVNHALKRMEWFRTIQNWHKNSLPALTPGEIERLAILAEESSEVIKTICKVLRFGYENHNPNDETPITNRTDLAFEIGHFESAVSMLVGLDIDEGLIDSSQQLKDSSRAGYLFNQHDQRQDLIQYYARMFATDPFEFDDEIPF